MMKTALLWVCLLALPAAAQDRSEAPGPGTTAPSSGNCGYSGLMGANDLHSQLQALFDDVFPLTGITTYKPQLVYIEDPGASPARCRGTGGQRDATTFEIAATQRLCEFAHSEDEVAVIFAHELAHFKYRDTPALHQMMDQAMAECGGQKDCATQKVGAQWKPIEDRSDLFAYCVLKDSRYRPKAGVDAMAHYRDILWALDLDQKPDWMHNPPGQRADAIRDFTPDMCASLPPAP